MDWKKASQIAQVVVAIPAAGALLSIVYDNIAKIDDSIAKVERVEWNMCIAEARSDLNDLRLSAIYRYSKYINAKVNQARSDSEESAIGLVFGAPSRNIKESKKLAEKYWKDAGQDLKNASELAERIEMARRVGKNCEKIVLGFKPEPTEGGH